MVAAAKEGELDASSLLPVWSHPRPSSAGWGEVRRQTAAFTVFLPRFQQTEVSDPKGLRLSELKVMPVVSQTLLCRFRGAVIFVDETPRSASWPKGFKGGCDRSSECWQVHAVQPAPWQKGLCFSPKASCCNSARKMLTNQRCYRLLKVFAVSKKVHTTRARALGVLTEDDTQIVRAFSLPAGLKWWREVTVVNPPLAYFRFCWTLLVSPLHQRPKGAFSVCFSSICMFSVRSLNGCSVCTDTSWRRLCSWIRGTPSRKLTWVRRVFCQTSSLLWLPLTQFKSGVCSSGRHGGCGRQMDVQQAGLGGAEMLGPAPTNPSNPRPEQGILFFVFGFYGFYTRTAGFAGSAPPPPSWDGYHLFLWAADLFLLPLKKKVFDASLDSVCSKKLTCNTPAATFTQEEGFEWLD